jgi:hypothetical protein
LTPSADSRDRPVADGIPEPAEPPLDEKPERAIHKLIETVRRRG